MCNSFLKKRHETALPHVLEKRSASHQLVVFLEEIASAEEHEDRHRPSQSRWFVVENEEDESAGGDNSDDVTDQTFLCGERKSDFHGIDFFSKAILLTAQSK